QQPAPVAPARLNTRGLIADVARAIGPDHVLGRNVTERAGLPELLPCAGLSHAQARQVGCAADLQPRAPQGIGLVAAAILVQHRTMARVLVLHLYGRLALDVDRVLYDSHRLPRVTVAILVRR